MVWFSINSLPEDMIEFEKIALNNYLKGIKFSTIYVNNEENK